MATRNTKAIATLRIWFGEIGSVAGWPITYRSEYIASEFKIYYIILYYKIYYITGGPSPIDQDILRQNLKYIRFSQITMQKYQDLA